MRDTWVNTNDNAIVLDVIFDEEIENIYSNKMDEMV